MEGTVTIKKDHYLYLRIQSERLNLLEIGGVDNWEWYGESLFPDKSYSDNKNIDEIEEDIIKEIEEM